LKELLPNIHFDRNKPFYPIIISHIAQLHGFVNLASRGLISELDSQSKNNIDLFLSTQKKNFNKKTMSMIETASKKQLTPQIGKIELQSKHNDPIKINIDELGNILFNDHQKPLEEFIRMSSGGLLILAWEITTDLHSKDPLWEFLRHCRNAAAHKGRFNFLGNEPKRPASWNNLEITRDLQGKPLFPDLDQEGYLETGDAIYLLSDIESNFIT
jgi:hypothetical protein